MEGHHTGIITPEHWPNLKLWRSTTLGQLHRNTEAMEWDNYTEHWSYGGLGQLHGNTDLIWSYEGHLKGNYTAANSQLKLSQDQRMETTVGV